MSKLEEEVIKSLYEALNNLLPLFILDHGTDYNCVDESIAAMKATLDAGYNLPTTIRLYEIIQQKEVVKPVDEK